MAKPECGNEFRHRKCGLAGTWPNCEASFSRNAACLHSATNESIEYADAAQAHIDAKRAKRMEMVDDLPKDIRDLVHEYGLTSVKALLDAGVSKPARIRHIVETILDEFSPTRGSHSHQGPRRLRDTAATMTAANPIKG